MSKKSHKYFLKEKMQKKLLLCAQVSDIKLNYKKCLLETDAKLINANFLSNQFYTLYNTTFIVSYLDAILDEIKSSIININASDYYILIWNNSIDGAIELNQIDTLEYLITKMHCIT